ncbi:MAG: ABC transporter permease [Planctomycetes bacterium]|nr:ABC transporter permease [Planctomycetota bacterium]MCC7171462.1 ABC transporter permease [Planctomycetota bacterium]
MNRVPRVILSTLAPFLGLVLVVLAFWAWGCVAKPDATFLTPFRMTLIAKQTAIVGMGALGMTLVIVSAGIDLAVGSLLALTSVVLALLLRAGVAAPFAVLATLGVGALAGAVNGLLVTRLKLVPFIVTLGTMLLFRGVAEQIASQQKIATEAPAWLSSLLDPPPAGAWPFVCTGVWIVVLLGVLVAFVLKNTVLGRHVVAVGSSEPTARLCGIAVDRVKVLVYTLCGLCIGIAGLFQFANLNRQGDPTGGSGLELEVIAAVVIGGGSLNGGRGSVLGSLIGALLMTTLRSGCVFAEVPDPIQKIVIGAIIVVAVALDQWRKRAA